MGTTCMKSPLWEEVIDGQCGWGDRARGREIMGRRQVGTHGLEVQAQRLCHCSDSSLFSLLTFPRLDSPVIFLFQVFLKRETITH